jgi:hypothetical protein
MDEVLHAERLGPRGTIELDGAAHGTFVVLGGEAHVVVGERLLRWTPAGYVDETPCPARAVLLTPPTLVNILRSGWAGAVPLLHPSARA